MSLAVRLLITAYLIFAAGGAEAQNLVDAEWELRPMDLAVHRETFREIDLVGMRLPPARNYDIPLADPKATVQKIKAAIDRVQRLSPVAARGIGHLIENGRVRIIYDAAFPKKSLSRVVIAAYMVAEFTPQHGKRDFTVLVGRFGANWRAEELAAVLVHELIGHGIQRLQNRFGNDRPIDLECEARLWQQMYYEDAGMALDTQEMVDFRNTTNRRVCHDFRQFTARARPEMMRAWDRGRPDMPGLLNLFQEYYAAQREAGAGGK